MMKNIIIISAVFPPEQVTSALLNYDLAKELSKNYQVTVLRPYPTRPIGMKFEYDGLKDVPFETILIDSYTHPKSELIGRFKEARDFSKKSVQYLKVHKDEIDFVYNDGWQLFGLNIIAKACVKYCIPYIVPIQDIYPECLLTKSHIPEFAKKIINYILLPIDKYYQKHAYRVRTISDEMADYLSSTRKIDRNKYLVVNNWQNDDDFKNLPAAKSLDKIVFEYVGSINVHANVDLMIKAFAEANIPNSELKIYGGGNQKENCQQLVKDLGLTNVSFGFVSRNEIPAVQSDASVLILALPSGNGNLCLPSKLTSYLLSGKPVLASVDQDSSTKRILEGEGCGKTVVPDNKDALIKGFKYFAEMAKEEREKMGEKSREYATTHLTRDVNLSLVIDSIKQSLQ
jgi:glycosyltransferase involved in cell wall biosynthesis